MEVTTDTAALVTGAGSGIGQAIAMRLAKLGANVTVVDISEDTGRETVHRIQELRRQQHAQKGGDAVFVKCDVACPQQLSRAFAMHMEAFKRLDICINNAGIAENGDFLEQRDAVDPSELGPLTPPGKVRWRQTIDINLKAVADGVRLAVQCMEASKVRGSAGEKTTKVIANVASSGGLIPMPGAPVYSATKAGVVMLTRSLAHLEKTRGIRVCAFCPQFIDTALVRSGGEALKKAVMATGGFIPMETAVEGIMKLIRDDRNGGSVMRVTARRGYYYKTFMDLGGLGGKALRRHAGAHKTGKLAPASGISSQHIVMPILPERFRKVVVTQLSTDFQKATTIVSCPIPSPIGKGKVLVRNGFAGVNASDINFSVGRYEFGSTKLPFDCGFESVGQVVGIGEGALPAPGISIGSPVATLITGGFSEYLHVHSQHVIPVPEVSPAMVAMLTSGLTASIALECAGRMGSGETVLVTAAAGGTGQFAVQLAKLAGNTVIGTCGGPEKASLLHSLGADRIIDYRRENVQQVLSTEFPNGVDLIYESVGGKMFETALKSLAIKGRLIIIGMISQYATGDEKNMRLSKQEGLSERLLMKSQSVVGFFLPHYNAAFRTHLAKLHHLYSKGLLKVAIDPTPFVGVDRVVDAVEFLHSGKSVGKVVVKFPVDTSLSSPSLRAAL